MPVTRLLAATQLLALTAVIPIGAAEPSATEGPSTTTVYRAGQDGYHTYRIPTLIRATNGDLLAFAEGRKNGQADDGDIDIVLKRSSDGGTSWSDQQVLQDEWDAPTSDVFFGNPTPVVDSSDPDHPGRVWLVFTRNAQRFFTSHSDDHGRTWSDRFEITPQVADPDWKWCVPGPVHAIQLTSGPRAGRLVIPCDHRSRSTDGWGSHLIYSDDHGQSWQIGARETTELSSPLHPNECFALELPDGRLYINTRDQHGSDPATRAVTYSEDAGDSFVGPFQPDRLLRSPVVQNSAITLQDDDGPLILYSGPSHANKRVGLMLRISRDNGASWSRHCVISPGTAAYSDLTPLDNNRVGLIYETGESLYDEIVFCSFELSELEWADGAY
ncbi:Sialidase precursor [Posidoniimonas polymericola]|uniref:exo-alpha-sialidase n=1 Tax=Posidoniimonas polymericola TaxID=2528002 RepID=A0A5C5YSY0_9BACT|nr:sialidase family protein [Posidoniimonas polymericola]TWT78079.1 Sialidase precursor [Posidoniimonas polymericola]